MADGQLRGDAFARAMKLLETPDSRSTWHTYHVVGDLMRMGELQFVDRDRAFLQRLKSNLAQEVTPVNNKEISVSGPDVRRLERQIESMPAGNEAQFRWKAWGGIASLCAVSFVVWQMSANFDKQVEFAQVTPISTPDLTVAPPRIAAGAGNTLVIDNQGVMIRDPRLDALLAAHQQSGGASAFQNPTGFVRSATFTGVGR